jgi:hypothetical protein
MRSLNLLIFSIYFFTAWLVSHRLPQVIGQMQKLLRFCGDRSNKQPGCLKNDRVTPPPISSGSRFRNRILDLNQIKSPCVQTIVLVVQALQRISRRRPQTGKAFGVCFGRLLREACV